MTDMLATLRRLKDCHQRLTAQAEALDWDSVLIEWQSAEVLFADLRQGSLASLTAEQQAEARVLMEELLAAQQAVAARIGPWMAQVQPMLDSFVRNRAAAKSDSLA